MSVTRTIFFNSYICINVHGISNICNTDHSNATKPSQTSISVLKIIWLQYGALLTIIADTNKWSSALLKESVIPEKFIIGTLKISLIFLKQFYRYNNFCAEGWKSLGKYLSDTFPIQYGLTQKFNTPFQIHSGTECEITFFEEWFVHHGHEFPPPLFF
jgi:hypothetical protein